MSNSATGTGFAMPPEWASHARTWMAWPCNPFVIDHDPVGAFGAWSATANAVSQFEPVTMIAPPGKAAQAREYLDDAVDIVEHPLGDSWIRDSGPTFVTSQGKLGAVDWTFNGWGGRTFPEARDDALVARFVAEQAGAARFASRLVNEGGGIHVDGEGTLLLTESVQLNVNRNPNWNRQEVEAECHRLLGTRHAIWLKRGVVADEGSMGTDGHIDTLACFVSPGVVVAHGQPDRDHPDFETAAENIAILRAAKDAHGKPLEVVVIDAPADRQDADGEPMSLSYVNFYICNGGIIACRFDDPQDEVAADTLSRLLPGRRLVGVDALRIFESGGGVHCITQQQPAV
ncbi:agmatine/peptidylarginine deiminase [Tepidamorphus sp. 3E244]|uniref:agmatine deiminase family protein n=1 Tax=Tepidamorphus sp. 3E244 TaxID=3385498 RepID=UPI0038FC4E25